MRIKITDMTPNTATLEMAQVEDIYGSVLVVKGWQ